MRWLADECVDATLVNRLRAEGHDVAYATEDSPGVADLLILRRAHDEERLLLTEDKDFGELVFRMKMSAPGLVLLRLDIDKRHLKWARLEAAIHQFGNGLVGRYVVVEERRLRSRPLLRSVR